MKICIEKLTKKFLYKKIIMRFLYLVMHYLKSYDVLHYYNHPYSVKNSVIFYGCNVLPNILLSNILSDYLFISGFVSKILGMIP